MIERKYPFDEWRVSVKIPQGTSLWSAHCDTWFDACFDSEPAALAYAERVGGRVYLQRWVAAGVKAQDRLL